VSLTVLFMCCELAAGSYSCDWPNHKRSVVAPAQAAACTCSELTRCNWLACADCFTQVTNDIKASFQVYNLQV
jgi:hypothetical protein